MIRVGIMGRIRGDIDMRSARPVSNYDGRPASTTQYVTAYPSVPVVLVRPVMQQLNAIKIEVEIIKGGITVRTTGGQDSFDPGMDLPTYGKINPIDTAFGGLSVLNNLLAQNSPRAIKPNNVVWEITTERIFSTVRIESIEFWTNEKDIFLRTIQLKSGEQREKIDVNRTLNHQFGSTNEVDGFEQKFYNTPLTVSIYLMEINRSPIFDTVLNRHFWQKIID